MDKHIHLRITSSLNGSNMDSPACKDKDFPIPHNGNENSLPWTFSILETTCPLCLKAIGKTFTMMVLQSAFYS